MICIDKLVKLMHLVAAMFKSGKRFPKVLSHFQGKVHSGEVSFSVCLFPFAFFLLSVEYIEIRTDKRWIDLPAHLLVQFWHFSPYDSHEHLLRFGELNRNLSGFLPRAQSVNEAMQQRSV